MVKSNAKKTTEDFRQQLKQLVKPPRHFPIAFENELHRLIQEEAYVLAEQDGFTKSPDYYWFAAEEKVYRNH